MGMHHVTWSWSEIKPLPKISPLESLTNPFKSLRFSLSLCHPFFFFFIILILRITYSCLYVCMRKWVCVVFFLVSYAIRVNAAVFLLCFFCLFCKLLIVVFTFCFCSVWLPRKWEGKDLLGEALKKTMWFGYCVSFYVSTLFPLNFSSLLTFLWWMLVWM